MLPAMPLPDPRHERLAHAKPTRENDSLLTAVPNNRHIGGGQLSPLVPFAGAVESKRGGMGAIRALGDYLKIVQSVIELVRVLVVHAIALWDGPKKCHRDEAMNEHSLAPTLGVDQPASCITQRTHSRQEQFTGKVQSGCSDMARVGHAIALPTRNRQPRFTGAWDGWPVWVRDVLPTFASPNATNLTSADSVKLGEFILGGAALPNSPRNVGRNLGPWMGLAACVHVCIIARVALFSARYL